MKKTYASLTVLIFAMQLIFLLPLTGWADPLPLTADAGGPYVIEIGTGLILDGSQTFDPNSAAVDDLKYVGWDIDNNGTDDCTWRRPAPPWSGYVAPLSLALSWAQLGYYGYHELGLYTVRLTVTDSTDLSSSDFATVTVVTDIRTSVSEPTTVLLLGVGLLGLVRIRRKVKR